MICDKIGNYCFRRFLEELKVSKDECLPSCHQVRFTSTKIISKLDPSEICAFQHETVENSIARFLVDYGYYDVLHHKRHVMRNGHLNESIYDLKLNLCKKLVMKDIAKVSISFESKKYVRTQTNVKTTFVDSLSSIGNTTIPILYPLSTYNFIIKTEFNSNSSN